MSLIESQRLDVDNYMLIKNVKYRKYSYTEDLGYGSKDKSYNDYEIKALINIQNISSRYVKQGLLQAGDAVGLLRYKYTHDKNNSQIIPELVPQLYDRLLYRNQWYVIDKIRPVTSEQYDDNDDDLVAWEITILQIAEPEE